MTSSRVHLSYRSRKDIWWLEPRTTARLLLILALLGLIGWLYVTQASQMATLSHQIGELEEKKAALQRENAQLTLEITRLQDLSRLRARALELGFVPIEQRQYVLVTNWPSRQSPIPESEDAEDGLPSPARWWGKVTSQFNAWIETQP